MSETDLTDLRNAVAHAARTPSHNPGVESARRALRSVADGIQSAADDISGARISVDPGYRTQLGQQFNIVLAIDDRKFRDVLFRAYIPDAGFPIQLDLYGEQTIPCNNESQLRDAIVGFTREAIAPRLDMLRER